MRQESHSDVRPWWEPALNRTVIWLLLVAVGSVAVVVTQGKLADWLWMSEAGLMAHLKYLALEIHLSTVLLSWLATMFALAFALWIFGREFRKELSRVRAEATEELSEDWREEVVRRSEEIRSGREPGVPANEVLEALRAELADRPEENRDET